MLQHGLADTREEAVRLGNQFLMDGQFRHVCGEHQFKDDYFFYEFTDRENYKEKPSSRQDRWFSLRKLSKTIKEEQDEDLFP